MNLTEELKKSQDYILSNDLTEAEKIFTKIIKEIPNNLDALMGIGIIEIKKKNYKKSIKYFKKIISLSKNSISAYINLGNTYIILKQYNKAIKTFLNAKEIEPKNSTIIDNLSFLYLQIENLEMTKKIVDIGLKLNSKNFFLLNIKGSIYIKKQRVDSGVSFFKKSINLNKNFWPAYQNLFNVLEKSNQLDVFNSYLTLANNYFQKNLNLDYFKALYYYRLNNFQLSKEILLQINLEKTINNKEAFLIKYYDLLAKNYDKMDACSKAFESFSTRNKLKLRNKENQKYDKKIILNNINNYFIYFKKKNIKKFKNNYKASIYQNPFFLIGFPRSGTTLLDSIIRSHSNTVVLEEQPFISEIRDKFFLSNNNLLDSLSAISDQKINLIQQQYFELINKLNIDYNNKIIIDKLPLNLMEVGFINKIFPSSKYILVLRHPCDVILSCFITDFKINEGMVNFLKIEDTINLYDKIFSLWLLYVKQLKIDFHIIKYEDIIYNFDQTIEKLLIFLGLEWQQNIKNFQNTAKNREKINTPSYNQVIQPLYNQSIGRWSKYEKFINLYPKLKKWINEFNY